MNNSFPKILQFCVILLILFIIDSCRKKEEYSVIPYIQFKSFAKISNSTAKDDKGILTITFTDGDGDIGLAEGDTTPPYNKEGEYFYDLFVIYFERQNGKLIEVTLPGQNNVRLPLISLNGKNKNIKGDIEDEIFINNINSNYDTIAFQVYIVDRALHKSNIIMTPDIIVNK